MDTLPTNLTEFLAIYPEFASLFTVDSVINEEMVNRFESIYNELQCIYPEFEDMLRCGNKYPFYMLCAHYFVMGGYSKSIGILPVNGIVSNSSVGDVSVSYQQNSYGQNDFTTYLSLTPYGRKYLAWLQRQAGLHYVN